MSMKKERVVNEDQAREILAKYYVKPVFEANELLKMVRKKGLWGVPDKTLKAGRALSTERRAESGECSALRLGATILMRNERLRA